MPTNKDFKRLVRRRMQKTGESYTTARIHLLNKTHRPATRRSPQARAVDYAVLAGMSDAAVKKATGCDWERWAYALDRVKAHEWPHPRIARYVHEKFRTPAWWAQMVTVGYERIKGLRAIGQRRDGAFEANKSRTFAVPVGRLYREFAEKRRRDRRLSGLLGVSVRSSKRDRSIRLAWPDDTRVELWFTAKGAGKSQVQIQHSRLPDLAAVARMKAFWDERLKELGRDLPGR
ncbi:MAG: hypothetical protein AB7Q69_13815 [Gemmatimonadales bacterium]